MDFFEHQDQARRHTRLLVMYYGLAVVMIIIAVYFAFAAVFLYFGAKTGRPVGLEHFWNPVLAFWVMSGTLMVVAAGSLYKIIQLAKGGEVVAAMLGGRRVMPGAANPAERRLLNVVEEMAIASGTPIPEVYVLDDEPGINAFAAGYSPTRAVVAVTRGCLQILNRDELQGVIGHEFSHILNGDMRLNIWLIGVLNGILVIALIGYWMIRMLFRGGRVSSSRSSRSGKKGGGMLPVLLLGVALLIIGYIGVFFAKLIKSAVSRQREFLADAASVQFTRNPGAIGGALKKIGAYYAGSKLQAHNAEEASHLFFANGLGFSFLSLFATHPPLPERIRRIDPAFDGNFPDIRRPEGAPGATGAAAAAESEDDFAIAAAVALPARTTGARFKVEPRRVTTQVGTTPVAGLEYAAKLIGSIPLVLRNAVRNPDRVGPVFYSLLLSPQPAVFQPQLQFLTRQLTPAELETVKELRPDLEQLPVAARLPLVHLALPALRQMNSDAAGRFLAVTQQLIASDQEVDLFEYMLQRMLQRHLDPALTGATRRSAQYYALKPMLPAVYTLLSGLARFGSDEATKFTAAYQAGLRELPAGEHPAEPLFPDQCGLAQIDAALTQLQLCSPAIKRMVLQAGTACVGADRTITMTEAELLRAVADSLDCPLPPFLDAVAA